MGKEDVVVVWNDANDINRNETHIGLTHIREYVHARTNINVLVMTAPHRFDLNELSCINKEIQVYNHKLKKMMKVMQHSGIVETTVTRSDFTKQGLHL